MDPVWSQSLHQVPGLSASLIPVGENVQPTHTIATAPPLDVLIVPGGIGTRAVLVGDLMPSVEFINATYPALKYLYSVCTGNALTAKSVSLERVHPSSRFRVFFP